MSRLLRSLVLATLALAVLPALALAHPLGNFTINHFAGVRVGTDRVDIDVVIDRAEIPAFQARQVLDTDANGTVSATETDAARRAGCSDLLGSLALTVDRSRLALQPTAAGLSFPAGAGGLPTMRLVCQYSALLIAPIDGRVTVSFADTSFAERIGWREIVVAGDGVSVAGAAGTVDLAGVSNRLTSYPEDLLAQPLDMRSLEFAATPGGPALAAWTAPDAEPLDGGTGAAAGGGSPPPPVASVAGGIGAELAAIIDAPDLSPAVVLGALLVAVALGAAHAVSPGHGKTIMAAYLVGTRGTARHAIALGLTVTVAHTLGVMALAALTLLAAATLPPERLYPILGVVSGALVVVIGGTLLAGRLRVLLRARRHALAHRSGDDHDHAHDHDHGHDHEHGHDHAPLDGGRLSWRGLFALGLSGGLVPSASALILLLGSIAAGRIEYGALLVLGFGVGMALVLGGVGLALVHAARLIERLPTRGFAGAPMVAVQAATAAVVVVLGVVLTGQALIEVL